MSDRSSLDAVDVVITQEEHAIVYAPLPPGFLRFDEAECLAALASGQTVLEVGSFLGRSTVAMARTAALVVAVDHHRGSPEHQPDARHYRDDTRDLADPSHVDTAAQFLSNLTRFGVRDRVMPIFAPSERAIEFLCAGYVRPSRSSTADIRSTRCCRMPTAPRAP
jgi:hypothetical protein